MSLINTNQMIVLQHQRVVAEETRKAILTEMELGHLDIHDIIRNKYINHALFGGY